MKIYFGMMIADESTKDVNPYLTVDGENFIERVLCDSVVGRTKSEMRIGILNKIEKMLDIYFFDKDHAPKPKVVENPDLKIG